MPSDIAALAATIVLAPVQLSISSIATLRQAGPAWVAGPRDEPREITGVPGRLARAHRNLLDLLV